MIVTKSNITTEKRKYWTRDVFDESDRDCSYFFLEGAFSIFNRSTMENYNLIPDFNSYHIDVNSAETELKFKNKDNLKRFVSYCNTHDWLYKCGLMLRAYLPTLASGRIAVAKDVNVASNKKVNQPYRHRTKGTLLHNLKQLVSLNFVRGIKLAFEIYDERFTTYQGSKGLIAINRVTSNRAQKEFQSIYDLNPCIKVRGNNSNVVGKSISTLAYVEMKPVSLTDVKNLIALAKQEHFDMSEFFDKFITYHYENNLISAELTQQLYWANEMFLNKTKAPKNFVDNEAYRQMIDINRSNSGNLDFFSNEKYAYDKASAAFNTYVSTLHEFFKFFVEDYLTYVPERIYVRYNEDQALARQLIDNKMYHDWSVRNKMAKTYVSREERFRDQMFAYKPLVNEITTEGFLTQKDSKTIVFEDDVPIGVSPNVIGETTEGKIFSMFPKELLTQFDSLPVVPELIYDSSMRYDWGDKLETEENYYKAANQGMDFGTTGGDILFLSETTYSTVKVTDLKLDAFEIDEINYLKYEYIEDRNKDKTHFLSPKVIEKLVFRKEKKKNFIKALIPDFTGEETDWQVQEIKERDLLNGYGFVPVMVPITYDDFETFSESKDPKPGFMVILVNFGSITALIKKTAYQEAMLQLLSSTVNKQKAPLFFTDRKEFLRQLNTVASRFSIYNNKQFKNLLKIFGNATLSNLENRIANGNQVIKNEVPQEVIASLFAKPKISENAREKIEKQKNIAKDIADKYTSAVETFNQNGLKLTNLCRTILFQQKKIRNLNNEIRQEKLKLQEQLNTSMMLNASYKESVSSISGYIKPKLKADKLLEKANQEYNLEIKKAMEENRYDLDPYLKNLAMNDIRINKIETEITNSGEKKIKTLVFSVLKPVRIKVDGSDKNVVYGGPYTLFLHDGEKMHISLLDPTSIIGWNESNKTAYIHPHASSTTLNGSDKTIAFLSLYESNNRYCCLGEASPYIWKSMTTGDLTMTIVNAMIWLTSANSADYWGRNYIHFPKTLQHNELEAKTAEEIAKEIMTSVTPEDEVHDEYDDHSCTEYEDGHCIHCDRECDHDEHDDDGHCIECGLYHDEWVVEQEDEEYEEELETTVNVNVVNNTGYVPYTSRNN